MEIPALCSAEHLTSIGFRDPGRAQRILVSLAGQGVTDDLVQDLLPSLSDAVRICPDPDRALNNFERWANAVTSRYTQFQYLLRHPAALRIFFSVCGVSQHLADILHQNPEYFEILANPGVRGGAKSAGQLYAEISQFVDPIQRAERKLRAMRAFRRREMLRIGTRDILCLADMPSTALEFSNLADACVQKTLELAYEEARTTGRSTPRFTVIGMGKLGGRELNYSSDIDLLFVTADDEDGDGAANRSAIRLAEYVIRGLSQAMDNGHLFRVDMRLRPEGRFGPLVRTLGSYRVYYESWAEPWEQQALLKARAIAGDPRLGDAFMEAVTPFVYRRSLSRDFVREIRRNKERIEQRAELDGQALSNVKVGRGGIRDIEFTVQLLQLALGGRDPLLRTPGTLEALARLRQQGAISETEAAEMTDDYVFLRNVEHRLQLLFDFQTQTMPSDPEERRLLGRRLGFDDGTDFASEYTRRTDRVRAHFLELFLRDGSRSNQRENVDVWYELLLNVSTPIARATILERLAILGFCDAERAYEYVRAAVSGTAYGLVEPEQRRLFVSVCTGLVEAAARTGDPDSALAAVQALALEMPSSGEFYRTLHDGDDLLDRLCRLGASAPEMMRRLTRRLEWLDLLVSEEIIDRDPKTADVYVREIEARVLRRATNGADDAFRTALATYMHRERLRIAARDIWGEASVDTVSLELTGLADAVLGALLEAAVRRLRQSDPVAAEVATGMAIIGMGKLGGQELAYGSDWDLLFVLPSGAGSIPLRRLEPVAEAVLSGASGMQTHGLPVEADARLRPEGRFGILVRPLDEYQAYYATTAATWERQSLLKARHCAGCQGTGSQFISMVTHELFGAPPAAAIVEEIRAMKRRMETERLKWDERHADLKLGHGGLTDIEFTVQLNQMLCGHAHPAVRRPGTIDALHALAECGSIAAPDAVRLSEAYRMITAVRNRGALLTGQASHLIPVDRRRARTIARSMGFTDATAEPAEDALRSELRRTMDESRRIFTRVFLDGKAGPPGRPEDQS